MPAAVRIIRGTARSARFGIRIGTRIVDRVLVIRVSLTELKVVGLCRNVVFHEVTRKHGRNGVGIWDSGHRMVLSLRGWNAMALDRFQMSGHADSEHMLYNNVSD